jgi:tRNA dimethylallyltransferase
VNGAPEPAAGAPGALGLTIGLLGPTAVGKTAVAVAVARALGVRVISCDSMQVYRGFPVLTNQPTVTETGGVEHALVGFVDPLAGFSAAEYASFARPLIAEDAGVRGTALVAGGTGLYLRAAVAPLAVAPGDPMIRAELEGRVETEGVDVLYAELVVADPGVAGKVDPRNPRRVVRALEAVLVAGAGAAGGAGSAGGAGGAGAAGGARRPGWSGREDLWNPRYDRPTLIVGLDRDRQDLHARIDARVSRMLRDGAVEEVRRFRGERGRDATIPGGPGIRSAIGYPEICRYLDDEIALGEAAEQMAGATRRYARRQLTWLRKVRDAVIIDVQGRDPEEIAREILDLALAKREAEEPPRL